MIGPEVNLFHAAVISPALIYMGNEAIQGRALPVNIGVALLVIAVFVIIFHLYLAYEKTCSEGYNAKYGYGYGNLDQSNLFPTQKQKQEMYSTSPGTVFQPLKAAFPKDKQM